MTRHAPSDSLYHRLFSHPLMVMHLLRNFVPELLAEGVDFAGMERVNSKFHARRGRQTAFISITGANGCSTPELCVQGVARRGLARVSSAPVLPASEPLAWLP